MGQKELKPGEITGAGVLLIALMFGYWDTAGYWDTLGILTHVLKPVELFLVCSQNELAVPIQLFSGWCK